LLPAYCNAKVKNMSLPRIALSLILTLALAGAPVVQALAMAASSAPGSAGMHAGHAAQHAAAPVLKHGQHNKPCAQHDSCNGSCCANCAQSFTGVPPIQFHTDVIRPVLTPSVHHLAVSFLISLRERPPRAFFL
jgi:hypothetical protein